MEFYCVLSVSGSLASYHVLKENETVYKATLRTYNGRRDDIPEQINLQKEENGWQADPLHEEIVQSLVYAIEGNGR